MGWRVFLGYSCYGSFQRETTHVTTPVLHLGCVLRATCLWRLGTRCRGGSDPARMSLVYAIFCAVGFILLTVIARALSRQ